MKPTPTEQALFCDALELETPAAREAFLDEACDNDPDLRRRVEALLSAAAKAGDFLEIPPEGAAPVESPNVVLSEKAGDRIGRYKLLEKIGEGGCGVVYMAEQEEPVRRRVALKIIKLGMDTRSVVARFEAERQALAMMEHPNIATVLDGGETATGRPFFVMELVRGIPITDFCRKTSLSTVRRLQLFIQVCQAIQHAHQKGIIHRDLKPSNILVTLNDNLAVPKVIDFGIAKATGERLTDKSFFTQFHSFIGTPAYISPEQAEMSSVDIDTRSDIYSLGVLLYELLTGRTPFDGEQLMKSGLDEMRRKIRCDEPLRPSTRINSLRADQVRQLTAGGQDGGRLREVALEKRRLVQRVQGDLDWIVMKCLEKDRARRYETATGLVADLQRHLNHEPILARPVGPLGRLHRWRRRHPTIAAVSASMVLLLLVVASGATVAAWRVTEARDAEYAQRTRAEAANRSLLTANSRLAQTVGLLKLQEAEEQFRSQDAAAGVEQLATILRTDPSNMIAASRLVSALLHRNWALPASPPLKHGDHVTSCKFSPDEKHILTTSWDKTARIWDAASGTVIATLPHEDRVLCGNYSADGLRLVTASADGTARIWDSRSGFELRVLRHPNKRVVWAQYSPDGRRILTLCAGEHSARVWNAITGDYLNDIPGDKSEIISARFSPDNLRAAICTVSGNVFIWRADHPLIQTEGHRSRAKALTFSADGRFLFTGSEDQTARLWDSVSGSAIGPPFEHPDVVVQVVLSPDGETALTTSLNYTARLWNIKSGRLMHTMLHEGDLNFAAFSPDGKIALTTSMDNSARLWVVRTGLPFCQPLRESEAIYEGRFSADGRKVLIASGVGAAQVWNIESRRSTGNIVQHGTQPVAVSFSPDGRLVLSASQDGTVRVWKAATGEESCAPLDHHSPVHTAEFSHQGNRIVTGTDDGSAYIWDANTGALITGPLQHAMKIWFAEFSHDGQKIVTASGDGDAQIWDAESGKPLLPPMKHGALVNTARFSLDDRWIVTASENNSARVWDAHTARPVTEPLMHLDHVEWAEFSPDNTRIVSASSDNRAQVWDVSTGKPIGLPLKHTRTVQKATFSPDGLRVATASLDCTARVWDARTGIPITDPLIHPRALFEVSFSADGRRLLTSCPAGKSRLWDGITGCPLIEWIGEGRFGFNSRFDKTGERIVSGSADGFIRIWDSPVAPVPVPAWFIRLAEAVAGRRQTETGIGELVPPGELQQFARDLSRNNSKDFYVRLGRWFLGDTATRGNSAF